MMTMHVTWIYDLTTMKWKKVICVVHVCMFGFGLQLSLPDTATKRMWHSPGCDTTVTTQCVADNVWWTEKTQWCCTI